MLIPNFSIRLILFITAVAAIFFLIVNLAMKGHFWATPVATAMAVAMAALLLYAIMFSTAFLLTRFTSLARPKKRAISPFATDTLPPQVIPPVNSDDK